MGVGLPSSGGLGKGFFKENPCSLKEGTSIVWPYALKQQKDFADNEVLKTRPRFSSLKSGRYFNYAKE